MEFCEYMSDLRSFLKVLKDSNELIHVKEEVSSKYEVSALLKAFDGKKAVIFDEIEGFSAL